MPISGHYSPLNRSNILYITTDEGIYELYENSETIYFGCSEQDVRGVRGRLEKHLTGEVFPGPPGMRTMFRFESTSRPQAKLTELLDEYEHEHGCLPRYNARMEQAKAG